VSTLEEDKRRLMPGAEKGVHCQSCGQFAKIYKRALNRTMARQLILLVRYFQRNPDKEWIKASDYFQECKVERECAKLRFFGAIVEKPGNSDRGGGPHTGFYRVTPLGVLF
jgi:hypothetical protein